MASSNLPATPDAPVIEAENLACGYDGEEVLKDISFRVGRSEILFIIGGSGCGKSTLLRNLVGLNAPYRGSVKFFGQPFGKADSATRRALLKRFGVLFQGVALWTSLTLRQ